MYQVMWLCATDNHPVGVVKAYDEIEGRWKFYIGTGNGADENEDVQRILALGQKYHNLDFLISFCSQNETNHPTAHELKDKFV